MSLRRVIARGAFTSAVPAAALVAAVSIAAAAVGPPKPIKNGDFEKGGFGHWKISTRAAGSWDIYGQGDVPPGAPAPRGSFSPASDTDFGTATALTRTLHVGRRAGRLVFYAYWDNPDTVWEFGGRWNTDIDGGNQYFSFDLLRSGSGPYKEGGKHVRKVIFRPEEGPVAGGTPASSGGWRKFTANLVPYRGERIQLRAVHVNETIDPVRIGIDDVAIRYAK